MPPASLPSPSQASEAAAAAAAYSAAVCSDRLRPRLPLLPVGTPSLLAAARRGAVLRPLVDWDRCRAAAAAEGGMLPPCCRRFLRACRAFLAFFTRGFSTPAASAESMAACSRLALSAGSQVVVEVGWGGRGGQRAREAWMHADCSAGMPLAAQRSDQPRHNSGLSSLPTSATTAPQHIRSTETHLQREPRVAPRWRHCAAQQSAHRPWRRRRRRRCESAWASAHGPASRG